MKLQTSQTVFSALADPTRLRIIHLLSGGELCVCDLMSVLQEPQSKISRHLAYLRQAQLVTCRKEGLWMYYQLAKPAAKTFQAVLHALQHASKDFEELRKDQKAFQKNKKKLISCCL